MLEGETKEEYKQRKAAEKEIKRIQKLMKYAYPRQREYHMMRKRMSSMGDEWSTNSIDIMSLKRDARLINRMNKQMHKPEDSLMSVADSNVPGSVHRAGRN